MIINKTKPRTNHLRNLRLFPVPIISTALTMKTVLCKNLRNTVKLLTVVELKQLKSIIILKYYNYTAHLGCNYIIMIAHLAIRTLHCVAQGLERIFTAPF